MRFKNRRGAAGETGGGRSLLAVLDGVLLLTMLLAGVVVIVTMIETVASKTVTDLIIGLPTGQVGVALPQGVRLDAAQAVVSAPTGLGFRLAWWLVGPGSSLLVLAGAYMMHDIVTTARAGDPFVSANVRRVRLLGLLPLGYFVLTVTRSLVASAIQSDLGLASVATDVNLAPLGSAVVLFGLAQIWQRGVELRDEQRLTV